MRATDVIVGQEAVCPDGLGRVARVVEGVCNSLTIYVDTYYNNRCCGWDSKNVQLISPFPPPRPTPWLGGPG